MTDRKRNLIVSFVFMAFGIFLFIESMSIKQMMKNDVGSGFFPKIIAGAIIVMSLIRLIVTLSEPVGEKKKSNSDMAGGWLSILLVGIYVATFKPVGFIVSTIIYLFLQMLVLTPKDKRNIPQLAIIAIIAPLFIYVMFVYALNTPLPKGIFGF
jgi:putative tricarboxylic transport membrane protein